MTSQTPQVRFDGTNPGLSAAPILLTKKKERRKTLPMDLRGNDVTPVAQTSIPPAAGPSADPPPPPAPRASSPAVPAAGHDEWSEPALRTPPASTAMDEWTEFDLDSPE